MTLLEKAQIYQEKFPSILSERLVSQLDADFRIQKHYNRLDLLVFAFNWAESREGNRFWNDIRKLYTQYADPTEAQILDLFSRHNIIQEQKI